VQCDDVLLLRWGLRRLIMWFLFQYWGERCRGSGRMDMEEDLSCNMFGITVSLYGSSVLL
jgi:hypothetical protein